MRLRLALGAGGVLLALFGVFRLITQIPSADLLVLAIWLGAALLIHDGILSPAVVTLGWVISHVVPPRARRYLQAALIIGALVTVIAIPMIHRRDSQPKNKAILQQNFGGNLTLVLVVVAALSSVAYAIHVTRDRIRVRTAPTTTPDAGGPAAGSRE
jgi:hypothetical protein